jgi:hypothetical protein
MPAGEPPRVVWLEKRRRNPPQASLFQEEIRQANRYAGPKSQVTEDLFMFAKSLDEPRQFGAQRALHIYRNMRRRMERVPLPLRTVAKYYAARDAHDIHASRTITKEGKRKFAVPVIRPEDENRFGVSVHGCVDIGTLLASVLRINGMPAEILRENVHTYVLFRELTPDGRIGKWWKFDPLARHSGKYLVEFDEEERAAVQARINNGVAARGLDHGAIGIHSIKDFAKYGMPNQKARLEEALRALRKKKG